jgi:urocanate hydratase
MRSPDWPVFGVARYADAGYPEALEQAARSGLDLISAGPGSGKT